MAQRGQVLDWAALVVGAAGEAEARRHPRSRGDSIKNPTLEQLQDILSGR